MKSFYFLRHGQTDWNKDHRLQGATDIPLNDQGRSQAEAARQKFAVMSLDVIIASPLSRAKETAEIIATGRGIKVVTDSRLTEKYHGLIEGMTKQEVASKPPETLFHMPLTSDWTGRHMPLQAELIDDVGVRAAAAITEHLSSYAGQNILLVGHSAWFCALVYKLTGEVMSCDNAHPYFFSHNDDVWNVIKVD